MPALLRSRLSPISRLSSATKCWRAASLKARLDCAVNLYRRHLAHHILVSGGKGKSGFDEATIMAQYLFAQGISPANVLVDSEGVNTMATAINTSRIAHAEHFSRIIIVTQYYHIPRCILAFKKAGILELSADYPRYFEIGDLFATFREGVALPVYFIKMPGKE
jgi:vancomycin permeability regulator SanA